MPFSIRQFRRLHGHTLHPPDHVASLSSAPAPSHSHRQADPLRKRGLEIMVGQIYYRPRYSMFAAIACQRKMATSGTELSPVLLTNVVAPYEHG